LQFWRPGSTRRLPVDYVRLTIEIPDSHFHPREIDLGDLPQGWRTDESLTRGIGDAHFNGTPLIPLKVSSVVVDTEWNLLFSRDYAIAHATTVERNPIDMDPRLWTV
jgi:hypothetical protein